MNKYLKISIICGVIVLIITLLWCSGCSQRYNTQPFNDYQNWFTQLDPCEDSLDMVVTVRIRAFGSEAEKQAAWKMAWPQFNSKAAAGVCVSSRIPEIWVDLRRSKTGFIINPAILGHEMGHVLRLKNNDIQDPDL